MGVQVKLRNPLRIRAIPEHFCGGDSLRRGAISSVGTFTFTFSLLAQILVICYFLVVYYSVTVRVHVAIISLFTAIHLLLANKVEVHKC